MAWCAAGSYPITLMALDGISLFAFRNHLASRLDGAGHLNLLTGENGAGKTNILEAISLLAPGRGLRRATLSEVAATDGPGGFAVSAELETAAGPVRLGTGTEAAQPARRLVQVNGAPSSAIGLGEWVAISWLTPAMDRLFMDTPGARRTYMDRLAIALDPGHARRSTRYEAALRERNRLLSAQGEVDPRWFDAIEARLAEAGAALAQGRLGLVERLSSELATLPEEPFARPALAYAPGGPLEVTPFAAALAKWRPRERAAQRTLIGPHRDELQVVMAGSGRSGGQPAEQCSTGEQKAMLIAITLTHAELAAGARPGVVLLDEVAAHLDPVRRAALFERLHGGKAQVWLTGTELAPFEEIAGEAVSWKVSSGTVERG